jgi:uncharacterized protein (TIGR00730 family)
VAVYCASRLGTEAAYAAAATQVGELLGRRHADLVFGGARSGMMGLLADAAIAGGCHVLGVMPDVLAELEIAHDGLSELRVVADLTVRKREMYDAADAFLALPGGIGTMEELMEVLSWASLGLHDRPVGLLNVGGYYDHLLAFLDHAVAHGLMKERVRGDLLDDDDPDRLLDRLLGVPPEHPPAPDTPAAV